MSVLFKNIRGARRFTTPCLSLLLAAAFLAPVPAHAQADTQAQLNQMQNELQTLSRAVFRGEKPPAGQIDQLQGNSPTSPNASGLELRLSQAESTLANLTGKVEEQSNTIIQLQKRIADLEAKAVAAPAGATGTMPPQPSGFIGPGGSTDAEVHAETTRAATPDTAPPGDSRTAGETSIAAAPAPAGTLGRLQQTPDGTLTGNPATLQYDQAFAMLQNKQYEEAQKNFTAFLAKNPNSDLAPNARYWLAETFYARNDFDRSARAFAEAYQLNPKGPKGPDSLLKLGLSLAGAGKKDDACLTFAQLKREYTTGAGPVLDRAQQEGAKLGCP